VPTSGITNVVEIAISSDDFNDLLAQGLCTSGSDCYMDIQESAILDTVELSSITESNVALRGFTRDSTPPSLSEFTSFDLVSGLLNLTFSESVDVSTLNTTGLTLQSFFEGEVESYRLSNLSSSSPVGPFVSIELPEDDISAIKSSLVSALFEATVTLLLTVE